MSRENSRRHQRHPGWFLVVTLVLLLCLPGATALVPPGQLTAITGVLSERNDTNESQPRKWLRPLTSIPSSWVDFVRQRKWSRSYRFQRSMEEHVQNLQGELEAAREELSQLREIQQQEQQQHRWNLWRLLQSKTKEEVEREERIQALQEQVSTVQAELESLQNVLKTGAARVQELQSLLVEQEQDTKDMQQLHRESLADLTNKLQQSLQAVSPSDGTAHKDKLQEAVAAARRTALDQVQKELDRIENAMKKQHQQAMEEERQWSVQAVKRERQRLRQLVQALAKRETLFGWKRSTEESLETTTERQATSNSLPSQRNDVPSVPTTRGGPFSNL